MQVDSLPTEPPEKPKNTEVVAYPFSRGASRLRNRTGVSYTAGDVYIYTSLLGQMIENQPAMWGTLV